MNSNISRQNSQARIKRRGIARLLWVERYRDNDWRLGIRLYGYDHVWIVQLGSPAEVLDWRCVQRAVYRQHGLLCSHPGELAWESLVCLRFAQGEALAPRGRDFYDALDELQAEGAVS